MGLLLFILCLFTDDCQTRLFLHKLCVPALAARRVDDSIITDYVRLCILCLFFSNMEILPTWAWCYFFNLV